MISVTIHNDFDDKLKINKDAICKLSTEVFKREKFNNSQIDIILTDKKFLNSLKKNTLTWMFLQMLWHLI